MKSTSEVCACPCGGPPSKFSKSEISRFFFNLSVHWRNWWNRKTARAYKNLTKAMRDDELYAMSWKANIQMPIYDMTRGKLTIQETEAIADRLMKHLFGVDKKP